MSNAELDAVLRELRRHGQDGDIRHGGKHLRVYFQGVKGRVFVTVCSSSGDANSPRIAIGHVRRALGITGARAKSTRPGRRRPRVVVPPELPREVTPGGPGLAGLERHPLMPAVLQMRADAAWRDLWVGICTNLFGAPSVAASMEMTK